MDFQLAHQTNKGLMAQGRGIGASRNNRAVLSPSTFLCRALCVHGWSIRSPIVSPQAGILVLFNVISILFIFPAMLSLDLRRRRVKAYDLLCCWSERAASDAAEPTPAQSEVVTRRSEPVSCITGTKSGLFPTPVFTTTTTASKPRPAPSDGVSKPAVAATSATTATRCGTASRWLDLPWLVRRHYVRWLLRRPARVLVLLTSLCAAGLGVWGAAQLQDGLDLTDVVPRGSDEFAFLEAQRRYFGFFEMVAVTQGDFEYPTHQRLLHQYHQAFTRVPSVIKNDDGGLPDFWLSLFRDWLIGESLLNAVQ